MSSPSQLEKQGKRKSIGHDDCFYRRPKTALLDDRQWLYIQRRYHISPRELQVAKLVCQGLTNGDIARDLHITLGTVKTHIRNIYRRIQVKSKIAMLLRFVDDAKEFFAQYNSTPPVPVVDLAKSARINPTL